MCCVKDSAADVFSQPMFVPATGVAVRTFTNEVLRDDPNNALNRYPADFSLYELGTFDDATGQFDNLDAPNRLIRAVDVSRS
ncbi:nonstructural protein [Blackfly microvirus SF02]|uniref:Nonstructural protein n=1 Tax=Blackfly microvirus SF02 TaxID=2576452 RepID=A0A4P8PKJ5_9VIRU|nr:nonstructural protein [Blackfly microvirus SF02]